MRKEVEQLKKWFLKEISLGLTYEQVIDKIISFRDGSSKEKSLYENWCYIDDDEWYEIERLMK